MSTLARQHFELIAAELRRMQPVNPGSKLGYHLACTAMANALAQINPRFDRGRFMAAVAPVRGEQFQLEAHESTA